MDECLTCGFNRGSFCFVTEFNKERMKMGGGQDRKPDGIVDDSIRRAVESICESYNSEDVFIGIDCARLSDQHWNYVSSLLVTHCVDTKIIEMIGFHYRSAFEHGYKHGVADASA